MERKIIAMDLTRDSKGPQALWKIFEIFQKYKIMYIYIYNKIIYLYIPASDIKY